VTPGINVEVQRVVPAVLYRWKKLCLCSVKWQSLVVMKIHDVLNHGISFAVLNFTVLIRIWGYPLTIFGVATVLIRIEHTIYQPWAISRSSTRSLPYAFCAAFSLAKLCRRNVSPWQNIPFGDHTHRRADH
jgi:hypothetical protein